MRKPTPSTKTVTTRRSPLRALESLSRRLRRARPGSVLILVIALLVLMALIGTAFISTAHTDRYAATQNTYNTQVELLGDGVTRMAQGAVMAKLQGNGSFRQASSANILTTTGALTATAAQSYLPYDSPLIDNYLAARTPILYQSNSSPTGVPAWSTITGPLGGLSIDTPYGVDAGNNPLVLPLQYDPAQVSIARLNAIPTAVQITLPDGTVKVYPALTVRLPKAQVTVPGSTTAKDAVQPVTLLAADADGDGIADSLYVRMPVGQVEGATYYGAVRIIDNNSAINASVAMAPYDPNRTDQVPKDGAVAGSVPGDFFPTNIDLLHMLVGYRSGMEHVFPDPNVPNPPNLPLNAYKFPSTIPGHNGDWTPSPLDDNGNSHRDYAFSSAAEAAWSMLGSRLAYPGPNRTMDPRERYRALPVGDGLNLAYHSGMANLNGSLSSILETCLPWSMGIGGPASAGINRPPYAPGDVALWYNNLFHYSLIGLPNMPLRPILVTSNPVSNFAPNYFQYKGTFAAATQSPGIACNFGDYIRAVDPFTGQLHAFVCVRAHAASAFAAPVYTNPRSRQLAYNTETWAPMPWTSHPTQVNVNTASFSQLWAAFWSVMQDTPDSNGVYPPTPGSGATPTDASNHQFRSPLRYKLPANPNPQNQPPVLTRSQVIQLRAALAAVNTIDMRDGDEDVTSRSILLTPEPGTNAPTYFAKVYGTEKQPFFTEMLIEYDPDSDQPQVPYVVIELYNPHPTPIPLKNWRLAKLVRGPRGITSLTEVGDLFLTLNPPSGKPKHSVIGPGERIIIESAPSKQPNTFRQAYPNLTIYTCVPSQGGATLADAANAELVLLRPRNAEGTPIRNNSNTVAPDNFFNEGTASQKPNVPARMNLSEMVPVDQLDLVGIQPPTGPGPGGEPPAKRYRYARANLITTDNGSAAWHCVYPGPYKLTAQPIFTDQNEGPWPYHMAGLLRVGSGGKGDTLPLNNGSLGLPKGKLVFANGSRQDPAAGGGASGLATYETRPLQLNNRDFAGPNRPYHDAPNNTGLVALTPPSPPFHYPLGGFARNGDMLNIPFIGAYLITDQNGALIEMNSVTMDSVMAQYQDPAAMAGPRYYSPTYDLDSLTIPGMRFHQEQIGHFCPMDVPQNGQPTMDDLDDPTIPPGANTLPAGQYNPSQWTYHFAKRLFDYLAVYTPQDDYIPNVDPSTYFDPKSKLYLSGDPTLDPSQSQAGPLTGQISPKYPATPTPAPNGPTVRTAAGANNGREDTAGTEGLVNLNTGNWKVISAVPFFSPVIDNNYLQNNARFAQALCTWRDSVDANGQLLPNHGPFRSLFDLMKLPQYNMWNQRFTNGFPGEAGINAGDYSPFLPNGSLGGAPEQNPTDHVVGDVKARFLALQRISNLVSVRSDSFTVYAQVQAWQGVGTPNPNLVAQRRAASLLDRSTVKPTVSPAGVVSLTAPTSIAVPNN